MEMKLAIITRCSRPDNLPYIKESIFTTDKFDITWYILFDTNILKDINAELLNSLQQDSIKISFLKGIDGDFGHQMLNKTIDNIDGFFYVLDDDNIIHEDFYESIYETMENNRVKRAFVFNQRIDFKDFTGQEIRYCSPDNMKVSKVDMAQVVLHTNIISDIQLIEMNYVADSIFIENVYNKLPNSFIFIDKILCYYNYLKTDRKACVPKVLYIGDDNKDLKSIKRQEWESDDMNVLYRKTDDNLIKDIISFNPDSIISTNNNIKNLSNINIDIKNRWIKFDNYFEGLGDISYSSSMNYILDNDNSRLISFFTPVYNTGNRILKTYESIKNQYYTNWEWVIVNDSSDGGKTLKIIENIASNDHRVKVYDFREKAKGVIGESKYRAAMLCRGDILVEMDHDDYLLPYSCDYLLKAFDTYPDAGFAYTDCAEVDDNLMSLKYSDGFCFGYGSYRDDYLLDRLIHTNVSVNINPKTIRHIVGVPNHIRAWKREKYLKLGGHNRRLSIADDYELIIRTFLETKFVKIPKNCYLQFIYNNSDSSNTHDLSRADIQRRVRSISNFYNFKIKRRFEELGVEDWAYSYDSNNPLLSPSKFGKDEGFVNYTLRID